LAKPLTVIIYYRVSPPPKILKNNNNNKGIGILFPLTELNETTDPGM